MASEKTSKKGRGGAITLVITLVLIVLIGTLAFIAVDRAIFSVNLDRSYINVWESQRKVLFPCDSFVGEEALQHQLCLIHSDGSGERQLTFDQAAGITYSQPAINASGQIVALCENLQAEVTQICLLHSDLPGEVTRIGNPEMIYEWPVISERGQLVFKCRARNSREIDRWRLCWASETQPDGEIIDEAPFVDARWPLALNDQGWVAYPCEEISESEICVFNIVTSQTSIIRSSAESSLRLPSEGDIAINNRGEIAFSCFENSRSQLNVCVSNLKAESYQQLNVGSPQWAEHSIMLAGMTDWGLLAVELSSADENDERIDIGVVGLDGTGFDVLSGELSSNMNLWPAVNETGEIAFLCDQAICVISSDGSGFAKLLDMEDVLRVGDPVMALGYPAIE